MKKEYFNENVYSVLDTLDKQTLNHCIRVGNIAEIISDELQLPNDLLKKAAIVHDIGKIYITQNILTKPSQLTTLERNIINLHAYYSYKILKELGVENDVCYTVLYHHGTNVLTLENIPRCEDKQILEYSRMLHTIDSYEALISDRVYRHKFTREEAISIMQTEKEHQPDVMQLLKTMRIYA